MMNPDWLNRKCKDCRYFREVVHLRSHHGACLDPNKAIYYYGVREKDEPEVNERATCQNWTDDASVVVPAPSWED